MAQSAEADSAATKKLLLDLDRVGRPQVSNAHQLPLLRPYLYPRHDSLNLAYEGQIFLVPSLVVNMSMHVDE